MNAANCSSTGKSPDAVRKRHSFVRLPANMEDSSSEEDVSGSKNCSRTGKSPDAVGKRQSFGRLSANMEDSSSEDDVSGSKDCSSTGKLTDAVKKPHSIGRLSANMGDSSSSDVSGSDEEEEENEEFSERLHERMRAIAQERFGDRKLSEEEKYEQKIEFEKSLYRLKGVLELILYQHKIRRERDSTSDTNQNGITAHVDESSSEEESESEQEVNESDLGDSSSGEEQDDPELELEN